MRLCLIAAAGQKHTSVLGTAVLPQQTWTSQLKPTTELQVDSTIVLPWSPTFSTQVRQRQKQISSKFSWATDLWAARACQHEPETSNNKAASNHIQPAKWMFQTCPELIFSKELCNAWKRGFRLNHIDSRDVDL